MIIACTPTRNRGWTMDFSVACMKRQTVQPDVWIVYDNSDTDEQAWKQQEGMVLVRVAGQQPIGKMRNLCIDHALTYNPDYIVFWDDDDYYHPRRIEHNIKALKKNPWADISASSKMFLLLTRENVMMTTGPFGDTHGTAATFCVRAKYVKKNRFDDTKQRGEELTFTKGWTANLVQVEKPEEMIVVMGHSKNTVNKSDLFVRPHIYNAKVIESANGKMYFRMNWNLSSQEWDLFRSTFSV